MLLASYVFPPLLIIAALVARCLPYPASAAAAARRSGRQAQRCAADGSKSYQPSHGRVNTPTTTPATTAVATAAATVVVASAVCVTTLLPLPLLQLSAAVCCPSTTASLHTMTAATTARACSTARPAANQDAHSSHYRWVGICLPAAPPVTLSLLLAGRATPQTAAEAGSNAS